MEKRQLSPTIRCAQLIRSAEFWVSTALNGLSDSYLMLLLGVLSLFTLFPVLGLAPWGPDYLIMQGPFSLAEDFGYWWRVFTSENGFGVQYRPLGFFGYFWLMEYLGITESILVWRVLSVACFICNTLLVFVVGKKIFRSQVHGFWAAVLFLLTPLNLYTVTDLSATAKYIWVTTILLLMTWVTLKAINLRRLRVQETILLTVLSALGILLHEGSLTFSIIAIAALATGRVWSPWRSLVILSPTILYLLVRVLVFEVPEREFMAVGLTRFPLNLSYIQLLSFFPPLVTYGASKSVILILGTILTIAIGGLLLWHRAWMSLLLYAVILTLIAPFCLLKEHWIYEIIYKGGTWSSVFVAFFLVSMQSMQKDNMIKAISSSLVLVLFLIGSFSSYKSHAMVIGRQAEWDREVLNAASVLNGMPNDVRVSVEWQSDWDPHKIYLANLYLPRLISRAHPDKRILFDFLPSERWSYSYNNFQCFFRGEDPHCWDIYGGAHEKPTRLVRLPASLQFKIPDW